jgi:DNA-binding LytR/AlgR family response regulator
MNLARGLDLARADRIDLAFLDISLGEEKSFPIARELAKRHIPFAFVTGYTDIHAVPEELRGATRIQKPYGVDDIRKAIGSLASPPASGLRATA